jgi:hypothetical protein
MSHLQCKFYAACHSRLDPESSVFLDSRFRGNDALYCGILLPSEVRPKALNFLRQVVS